MAVAPAELVVQGRQHGRAGAGEGAHGGRAGRGEEGPLVVRHAGLLVGGGLRLDRLGDGVRVEGDISSRRACRVGGWGTCCGGQEGGVFGGGGWRAVARHCGADGRSMRSWAS